MSGQAQVVVVAVELRVVSLATCVLVHGLQFEVATLEEVVKSHAARVIRGSCREWACA